MLTKKEMRLIEMFRKHPFESHTINELSGLLKTKSYSWTYNAVKKLYGFGIFQLEAKGHSKLVMINLNSPEAIKYMAILDYSAALERKIPNIEEIFKMIDSTYFTLIVGGSYASGTQTSKSDLDVVVILSNGADTKAVMNTLKNKGGLLIPEVHPYVFTEKEFLQMLLARDENYGKLLFRNMLIFFGAENYYLIVNEAGKHGFSG